MLNKNPDQRISIIQIEDDPWTIYGDVNTSSLLKTNPS